MSLFRAPVFSAALTLAVLAFFLNFGAFFLVAQYMQLVLGLSPFEAGLWSTPSAFGFIVGSIIVPRIAARVRPAFVMAAGFMIAAIGLALLIEVEPVDGLVYVVVGGVVLASASHQSSSSPPISSSAQRRPNARVAPRVFPKPAPNSAEHSASRFSAAS